MTHSNLLLRISHKISEKDIFPLLLFTIIEKLGASNSMPFPYIASEPIKLFRVLKPPTLKSKSTSDGHKIKLLDYFILTHPRIVVFYLITGKLIVCKQSIKNVQNHIAVIDYVETNSKVSYSDLLNKWLPYGILP